MKHLVFNISVLLSHIRAGDITKLNTTTIVNTTNESLSRKGILSERIHKAAGPELLLECKTQLIGTVQTRNKRPTQTQNARTFFAHTRF